MILRGSLPCNTHESIEGVLLSLGGFSKFQLWAGFVILIPEIPAAILAMLPVFVGANRDSMMVTRRPYLNDTNNTDSDDGSDVWVSTWGGGTFQVHETVVQEWGLHDELAWVTEMFTSVFMTGMMLGAFTASQLADRFGRKKIHFLLILIMATFGSACAFASDPYTYSVLRFMSGVGVGGYYCVYSIYLMEFLTPKWRVVCGSIGFWFAGEMMLAFSAYFIRSWRLLSLVASLPAAILLLSFPFFPETPSWLLCHNKTSEARSTFAVIARWNNTETPTAATIDILQKSVASEKENDRGTSTSTLWILWSSSKLRFRLLTFIFIFFSLAFTYYGISFNAKNLSGDPYLNMLYMGIVDMFAFPVGSLFSNPIGRRRVTSLFLSFASLFLVVLIALESWTSFLEVNQGWVVILSFLGRFGVAASWGVSICFASESFPTVVRSTALGICCLFANTGGVLAPQLAFAGSVWPVIPHLVFCIFTMSAAAMSLLLPEMRGKPLQNF